MHNDNVVYNRKKYLLHTYSAKVFTCISYSILATPCEVCRGSERMSHLSFQTLASGSRAHGPHLHAVLPKMAKRSYMSHSHSGM